MAKEFPTSRPFSSGMDYGIDHVDDKDSDGDSDRVHHRISVEVVRNAVHGENTNRSNHHCFHRVNIRKSTERPLNDVVDETMESARSMDDRDRSVHHGVEMVRRAHGCQNFRARKNRIPSFRNAVKKGRCNTRGAVALRNAGHSGS